MPSLVRVHRVRHRQRNRRIPRGSKQYETSPRCAARVCGGRTARSHTQVRTRSQAHRERKGERELLGESGDRRGGSAAAAAAAGVGKEGEVDDAGGEDHCTTARRERERWVSLWARWVVGLGCLRCPLYGPQV